MNRCQNCTYTSFDNDEISSTLHISIPNNMLLSTKQIPIGEKVKICCLMQYTEIDEKLIITAEKIGKICSANVVITTEDEI